ncbi:MAG: dihydropteroate synthase, partial [Alphaproteobacteria bacterium]|nr:dihydropteroate synthase [Alphaproteobacteria bacterium]
MTSLFAPRDLPIIMGVVNVTPDSFSDGGSFATPERAINHGLYLREQGANIIDVGGESTRPGADPVDAEQELARVLPVVQGLVAARAIVSVDTRQPLVMQAVLAAGAQIINDISAATHDPASLNIMAQHGAHVVLMHMQGQPQSMQEAPDYQDVVPQVTNFLRDR